MSFMIRAVIWQADKALLRAIRTMIVVEEQQASS